MIGHDMQKDIHSLIRQIYFHSYKAILYFGGKVSVIAILLFLVNPFILHSYGATSGGVIPQTNWRLWYVDSEETVGENGVAENAFDGSSGTIWHTQWYGSNPPPPHEIQIDLGGSYSIDGFRYLPRQDGGVNGTIRGYEFYVSADGLVWNIPVAAGVLAGTGNRKEVRFTAKTGQYVRLRAMSEVNGNPCTSVAEINVLDSNLAARDEYVAIGDSITRGISLWLRNGDGA